MTGDRLGILHPVVFHGTGYDEPRIDASTSAVQVITNAHHEIHGGSGFSVHIENTTDSTDDHRTLLGFETPAGTNWAHLVVILWASGAAEAFFYEGVTIDDGEGTEVTINDRNRNTANTSTMLSFENPAVAGLATWMTEAELTNAQFSAATTLEHVTLVAGGGPKAIGGDSRSTQEWILKAATKYAIVIQNIGASANVHGIELDWYEHTDHN